MKGLISSIALIWLGFLVCLPTQILADAGNENVEYKIKAGYLYNFTKFITWPDNDSPTFTICILGDDPFGQAINQIEFLTAFNKPIKLLRLAKVEREHQCQIVYTHSPRLNSLMPPGTLSVTEISNPENGATLTDDPAANWLIGFINQQGKIKLLINLNKLQQAGFKVSAKLLEVAEIVGDQP